MAAANDALVPQLDEDVIDDLLYCARAGELSELQTDISSLASKHSTTPLSIVSAAIDTYSGNTIVHYASANGHSDILTYILSISSSPAAAIPVLTRPNSALSTPLHYAALNGHLAICKLLLGAIPTGPTFNDFIIAKNAAGRDAAFEAESAGKEDVVTYLLGVMDEADGGVNGAGEEEGGVSVSAGVTNGDGGEEMEDVVDGVQEMEMTDGKP